MYWEIRRAADARRRSCLSRRRRVINSHGLLNGKAPFTNTLAHVNAHSSGMRLSRKSSDYFAQAVEKVAATERWHVCFLALPVHVSVCTSWVFVFFFFALPAFSAAQVPINTW